MLLLCTSHDLMNPAKELADIELTDLNCQVDLIYKSEVVVIYHEGLFKFLKCKTGKEIRNKYLEIFKAMKLEDDALPEYNWSKNAEKTI